MKKNNFLIIGVVSFVIAIAVILLLPSKKTVEPEQPKATTEQPKLGIAPHVILNNLRYTPDMQKAMKFRSLVKIPWGTEQNQVGGFNQDKEHLTEGMPWTFRAIDNDKFWILDSVNKKLKLFNKDGKCERFIVLSEMGRNIYDFAFSKDGVFAFYNNITGQIFLVNKDGKMIKTLNGFTTATSLEFAKDGSMLITLPVAKGKVKIAQDGQLMGTYSSAEELSIIESNEGGLYGLRFSGKKAELTLRTGFDEKDTKVLTTITYDKPQQYEVWYTGGAVYGKDAKGNVYFALIVCDKDGIIYSDRIYRCAPDGKILGSVDVVTDPELTSGLPRNRVVTPDGKVCSASYDENSYMIYFYQIPNDK